MPVVQGCVLDAAEVVAVGVRVAQAVLDAEAIVQEVVMIVAEEIVQGAAQVDAMEFVREVAFLDAVLAKAGAQVFAGLTIQNKGGYCWNKMFYCWPFVLRKMLSKL